MEADTKTIRKIAGEISIIGLEPKEVRRISKNESAAIVRLLRLKCSDTNGRTKLLRKCQILRTTARYLRVYLNPDQTLAQRAWNKRLRKKLKARQYTFEYLMISKGEIVHRPREGNQHSQSGFLVTSTFLTFFP